MDHEGKVGGAPSHCIIYFFFASPVNAELMHVSSHADDVSQVGWNDSRKIDWLLLFRGRGQGVGVCAANVHAVQHPSVPASL